MKCSLNKAGIALALLAASLSSVISSSAHAQFRNALPNATNATNSTNTTDGPVIVPDAPEQVTALIKHDSQIGSGAEAVYGSLVEVHYTGWLYKPKSPSLRGSKFDSSRDAGQVFPFQLGARQVIKGWDMGVMGMKVGGKRTLIIPSYLGYSTTGSGSIPPNAALIFDIELLSVK
ncbi:FKBP-type peptidyl-prolyl cis-trans isomerase [Undibacterium sp. Xuan67W]|uniref:FKBP-type peptidyl-prolyl cis-trans isomerase n=1 Tax=Undibacterium sp. Xuan67W TaxID=3413057 RepID=UPI003BF20B34